MRVLATFAIIFSVYGNEQSQAEDPLHKENDPTKDMSEEQKFAHELLSLFNFPMYTVIVPAGKTECYYHVTNETFHLEYTVEGGGALDIRFEAFDHKEESLIKFDKNTTGYHLFKITEMAPTKFCFDNSFSIMTDKKVHFELFPEIDMDEWDSYLKEYTSFRKEIEEDKENGDIDSLYHTGHPEWDNIHVRSNDMRKKLRKVLRILDHMRSFSHIDEALMENKEKRLNFWSFLLSALIPAVSIGQVIFVRMLFNPKTKISSF